MNSAVQFITTNWHTIVTVALAVWTTVNIAFNRIAGALPAPTAQSSTEYIWWFKFVNNLALNHVRANGTRIEDSPNFIPAAEKYMADKLAGGNNAPVR